MQKILPFFKRRRDRVAPTESTTGRAGGTEKNELVLDMCKSAS